MNDKKCLKCGADFRVPDSRVDTAKFCSRVCADSYPRARHTVTCSECAKQFHLKKSQSERNKEWGSFCSKKCNSVFRSRMALGSGNPNFRGSNYDYDGYRKYVPVHGKSIKLHHHVAFETLGIDRLPTGSHIHHRDCDIMNNSPENLQLLSTSDHKWIHKEYGSATLWAIHHNKLSIDDAIQWSSDKARALHILINNVITQRGFLDAVGANKNHDVLHILSVKPLVNVKIQEIKESK